ncbi:MAG: hypothetical protein GC134_05415 [Proteobacteria bacterium]|nr:hypothetical protein [Pseudomonadota bacterium]
MITFVMDHLPALACIMGYLVALKMFHVRRRRMFLLINAASCLPFVYYLLSEQAFTGALVSSMVGINCLLMAALPEHDSPRVKKLRVGFALTVIACGTWFMYKAPSDLLPMLAFIIARLGETQSNTQRIRYAFMPVQLLWMGYGYLSGAYVIVGGEFALLLSNLLASNRHRRTQKMAVE